MSHYTKDIQHLYANEFKANVQNSSRKNNDSPKEKNCEKCNGDPWFYVFGCTAIKENYNGCKYGASGGTQNYNKRLPENQVGRVLLLLGRVAFGQNLKTRNELPVSSTGGFFFANIHSLVSCVGRRNVKACSSWPGTCSSWWKRWCPIGANRTW